MDGGAVSVVVGLVLGFIPAALITVVLVVIVGVLVLVFTLVWLLEQPIMAWFYVGSLSFNIVVLAPLWVVSMLASTYEPELWRAASTYVYVFSAAFVCPTVLFYTLWQRAINDMGSGQ